MSNHQTSRWVGTALAGVLATLTALILPKRPTKSWKDQAVQLTQWRSPWSSDGSSHKSLLLGSVLGSLIGVTTALLLAPKQGSALIDDISHFLQPNQSKKSRSKPAVHARVKAKVKSAAHNKPKASSHVKEEEEPKKKRKVREKKAP